MEQIAVVDTWQFLRKLSEAGSFLYPIRRTIFIYQSLVRIFRSKIIHYRGYFSSKYKRLRIRPPWNPAVTPRHLPQRILRTHTHTHAHAQLKFQVSSSLASTPSAAVYVYTWRACPGAGRDRARQFPLVARLGHTPLTPPCPNWLTHPF